MNKVFLVWSYDDLILKVFNSKNSADKYRQYLEEYNFYRDGEIEVWEFEVVEEEE